MIFENQLFSHNRNKIRYIADLLNKYDKSRFYANFLENRENCGDFHDMDIIFTVTKEKYKYCFNIFIWFHTEINFFLIFKQKQKFLEYITLILFLRASLYIK